MPKSVTCLTKSAAETKRVAKHIAAYAQLARKTFQPHHALVISLEGNLGAGKTTFTQGFARALGIRQHLTSPTFVVMKKYAGQKYKSQITHHKSIKRLPLALYHIDCYRLHSPEELSAIGLETIINNPYAIVLIEWGDRIKKLLPPNRLTIRFAHAGGNRRKISIINLSTPLEENFFSTGR
ncbi:MAG: tRNA (adenosine(37)-N6)-threonylcarbamoyltransferase complex ATPase subunit type 1 TsaE [bacterium]|nr:tRNA (adenosine(37)-N6)-threonylcarbamoyltransferase complex ATPase subunit type 1 TsaE [bacterium]